MEGDEEYNWHGLRGSSDWAQPRVAVVCDLPVRPDQRNKTRADEFLDEETVLEDKVQLLAAMLRESGGGTVVYSGAGLSRAAGIADYASRSENSLGGGAEKQKKLASPLDAEPTASHCVIAQLVKSGLVSQVIGAKIGFSFSHFRIPGGESESRRAGAKGGRARVRRAGPHRGQRNSRSLV